MKMRSGIICVAAAALLSIGLAGCTGEYVGGGQAELLQPGQRVLIGVGTRGGGPGAAGTLFGYDLDADTLSAVHTIAGRSNPNITGSPTGFAEHPSNGLLYGCAADAGRDGHGQLLSLDPSTSELTVLHTFTHLDGRTPIWYPTFVDDDVMYGVTAFGGVTNGGVIFRYTLSTSTFEKVIDFPAADALSPLGSRPEAPLLHASDGSLYGTTIRGGDIGNTGTLYRFDPSSATPTIEPLASQIGQGAGPLVERGDIIIYVGYGGAFIGSDACTVQAQCNVSGGEVCLEGRCQTLHRGMVHTYNRLYPAAPNHMVAFYIDGRTNPEPCFEPVGVFQSSSASNRVLIACASDERKGGGSILEVIGDPTDASDLVLLANLDPSDDDSRVLSLSEGQAGEIFLLHGAHYVPSHAQRVYRMILPDPTLRLLTSLPASLGERSTGLLTLTDRHLWGMTDTGGDNGYGTLFSYALNGGGYSHVSLGYPEGAGPVGGMMQASNGKLYGWRRAMGMAEYDLATGVTVGTRHGYLSAGAPPIEGDSGILYGVGSQLHFITFTFKQVVYSFDTHDRSVNVLHEDVGSASGIELLSRPALDNGVLYFVNTDDDTLLSYDIESGALTTLHDFVFASGHIPVPGVVIIGSTIYGATAKGGSAAAGVIYSIETDGTGYANHDFDSVTGESPSSALMLASDGKIYGASRLGGGAANVGTLFSFNPADSVIAQVHDFDGYDLTGAHPEGMLIEANDGLLYGVVMEVGDDTMDRGLLYSVALADGTFKVLHRFTRALGFGTASPSLIEVTIAGEPPADAGTPDAGAPDAGAPDAGSSGGCGCNTGGKPEAPLGALLFVGLLVALRLRSRRTERAA